MNGIRQMLVAILCPGFSCFNDFYTIHDKSTTIKFIYLLYVCTIIWKLWLSHYNEGKSNNSWKQHSKQQQSHIWQSLIQNSFCFFRSLKMTRMTFLTDAPCQTQIKILQIYHSEGSLPIIRNRVVNIAWVSDRLFLFFPNKWMGSPPLFCGLIFSPSLPFMAYFLSWCCWVIKSGCWLF